MVKRATLRDKWVRGPRPMEGRQVWAHSTHQGQADYQDGVVPVYDAEWPLLLRQGQWNSPELGSRMAEVKAAGIDGLQVLIYDWEPGDRYLSEMLPDAEQQGVKLAPCYFTTDAGKLAEQAAQWIATAGDSTAAGREYGKYLIWVYSPSSQLDVPAFLSDSRVAGKVVLLGDLGTAASQTGRVLDVARADAHGKRYRAVWDFEDSMLEGETPVLDQVFDWARTRLVPFIGGVMPGYNRESPATGGYVDPRGTKLLREAWEKHLAKSWVRWVTLVTWQDFTEGHTIRPTSQWHYTRADVCRWYSNRLKGLPQDATPQLYVTAPTHIHVGEKVNAEALVLNGSAAPASVKIELLNSSSSVVSTATSTIQAGQVGDATTNDAGLTAGWVRPRATMTVGGSSTVVMGAPVLIFPAGQAPTSPDRRRYNSVAARKASGSATVSVAAGKATITASGGTARTVEVLQNTRSAGRGYGVQSKAATVPMSNYDGVGSQTYTAAATGWVIGRAVFADGSIAYSNPTAI